ncbi:MAG: acyltransferase [Opitutales bacterium]|nr:acyltransferase [Opitutales bacterium]
MILSGNKLLLPPDFTGNVDISGSNNELIVKSKKQPLKLDICIFGNDNIVEIGDDVVCLGTEIFVGTADSACNRSRVSIGAGTTMDKGCTIRTMEDSSCISVGKDVMCSERVHIWATDSHAILDGLGAVKNAGKEIVIGDHVWIGMDAKIGKNTKLGSGSVVGWGSVVTRGDYPENSLLAGNPASVKKQNIVWTRERPNQLLNTEKP